MIQLGGTLWHDDWHADKLYRIYVHNMTVLRYRRDYFSYLCLPSMHTWHIFCELIYEPFWTDLLEYTRFALQSISYIINTNREPTYYFNTWLQYTRVIYIFLWLLSKSYISDSQSSNLYFMDTNGLRVVKASIESSNESYNMCEYYHTST